MKKMKIALLFVFLMSFISCSGSSDSPTGSKTTIDSCSLGLCHYNETFTFNFHLYMKDGTTLQRADSVRLKFQYRRNDGTPVIKDTLYAFSEISPSFRDVFSVTKTYGSQMQINTISFACFNNKYGIRDTTVVGGISGDVATPGVIWVPGSLYNQNSSESIVFDSISLFMNGRKFDTLKDSLIMGDSILFAAAYRVSHGNYNVTLSYNSSQKNEVSSYLKTKVFDTTISALNGGAIKALGVIKWDNSLYIGPRTYYLTIKSTKTIASQYDTFTFRYGTYYSKLIPLQATTLKVYKYGNPDSQITASLTSYSMSPAMITQGEYNRIRNPSKYTPSIFDNMYAKVSWYDAVKFCNQKSLIDGLNPAYDTSTFQLDLTKNGYHLPTTIQWENALRAGTSTNYWWGDNMDATKLGTEFLGTAGFNKWGFSGLCQGEIVANQANKSYNHQSPNPFAQFTVGSTSAMVSATVVFRTSNAIVQSSQNASLLNHFRISRQLP